MRTISPTSPLRPTPPTQTPTPAMPTREPSRDTQLCLRCAYPLDADRSVLAILSHVRDMMENAGYAVEKLVVEQARSEDAPIAVSLHLQRAISSKRLRSDNPLSDGPASKRAATACRLCASSCCSTNSLCKANACGHRNEEVSKPLPNTPPGEPIQATHPEKTHHHTPNPQSRPPPQPHHHHHHHHRHQHIIQKPHHHRRQGRGAPSNLHQPDRQPGPVFQMQPPEALVADPDASDVLHSAPFAQPDRPLAARAHQPNLPDQHDDNGAAAVAAAAAAAAAAAVAMPVSKPDSSGPPRGDTGRDPATGWTATTAPPGASFDASRDRVLGEVDITLASSPVPTTTVQRSSQFSRMTSSEPRPDIRSTVQEVPQKVLDDKSNQKVSQANVTRPPPELSCNPCAMKFPNELDLRKHQFTLHKDDKIATKTNEGRFLCLMHSCTQSFVRRHVMERHFKTVHLLVKDFPCSSCDRAFADSSTRDAHRSAVHEKRKPWVCDQCSRNFTQSSSLGKHRRRFHKEVTQTNLQR